MSLIREEGFTAKVEKGAPFRAFHENLRNDKATSCEFLGKRETILEEAIVKEPIIIEDKRKSSKIEEEKRKS